MVGYLVILVGLVVICYCVLTEPLLYAAYFAIISFISGVFFCVLVGSEVNATPSYVLFGFLFWAVLFVDSCRGVFGGDKAIITQLKNEFE